MDVEVHFNFYFGGRDMDLCLDLCYFWGFGKSLVLKLNFLGGGGGFTWNS